MNAISQRVFLTHFSLSPDHQKLYFLYNVFKQRPFHGNYHIIREHIKIFMFTFMNLFRRYLRIVKIKKCFED